MSLKLVRPYKEFDDQLSFYEKSLKNLENIEIALPKEVGELISELYLMDEQIRIYLQDSFTSKENRYERLYASKALKIFANNANENNSKKIEHGIKRLIPDRIEILSDIKKYIFVGDVIRRENDKIIEDRSIFSMEEVLNLVLMKLYEIYDNSYYSVLEILIGNGIILKRDNLDSEIIQFLTEQRLVESQNYIDGNFTKLTPRGALHVENYLNSKINLTKEKRKYRRESESLLNFKAKLKNDLQNNELEEILKEFPFVLNNESKLNNDLILISGRFFQNKNHEIRRTLSDDEISIEYNRIRNAIIQIIEKLDDNDIH